MVLIFFVPYVIFQPPMTVITRKIGPTYFLGTIVILWGAILVVSRSARWFVTVCRRTIY